jgi:hypothetical protein
MSHPFRTITLALRVPTSAIPSHSKAEDANHSIRTHSLVAAHTTYAKCPHIYKSANCDGDHCSERLAFESDAAKDIQEKRYNIGQGHSG